MPAAEEAVYHDDEDDDYYDDLGPEELRLLGRRMSCDGAHRCQQPSPWPAWC